MNIMFWVILALILILVWFLFAALIFKVVGSFFYSIWSDAIDILLNGKKDNKEEK